MGGWRWRALSPQRPTGGVDHKRWAKCPLKESLPGWLALFSLRRVARKDHRLDADQSVSRGSFQRAVLHKLAHYSLNETTERVAGRLKPVVRKFSADKGCQRHLRERFCNANSNLTAQSPRRRNLPHPCSPRSTLNTDSTIRTWRRR